MEPPASDPGARPSRDYWAFISYSHLDDRTPGRKWASWLHQLLEEFDVPTGLANTRNARGELLPQKVYPVFRDEESLPAHANLSDRLRETLRQSRTLVVICSPRAVASHYVAEEIRFFKELGRADRIVPLIIAGEPMARKSGLECFPEPLRFGVAKPDGTIDWTQPTEPLGADGRPHGQPDEGWTTPGAYEEDLERFSVLSAAAIATRVSDYARRLDQVRLKVLAGVLGVSVEDLAQRDQKRQLQLARDRTRTLRRWLAAVSVLALFAVASLFFAQRESSRRRHQLREASAANHAFAERLLRESESNDNVERVGEALAYLDQAIAFDPENIAAIQHAASVVMVRALPRRPLMNFDDGEVTSSPNGRALAVRDPATHDVRWFDVSRQVFTSQCPGKAAAYWFQRADLGLLVLSDDQSAVHRWQPGAVDFAATFRPPAKIERLEPRGAGSLVAMCCADSRVRVWDAAADREVCPPIDAGPGMLALACSADGTRLAVGNNGGKVRVFGLPGGEPIGGPWETAAGFPTLHWQGSARLLVDVSDRLFIREVASGRALGEPIAHAYSEKLDESCARLITGKDDAALLWKLDGLQLESLPLPLPTGSEYGEAAFSPDGLVFVVGYSEHEPGALGRQGAHPCLLQLFDALSLKPLGAPLRHDERVREMAFSPDGKLLATTDSSRVTRVWDLALRQTIGSAIREEHSSSRLEFVGAGRALLVGGFRGQTSVESLWPVPDLAFGGEPMQPEDVQKWGNRYFREHPEVLTERVVVVETSEDGRMLTVRNKLTGETVGRTIEVPEPVKSSELAVQCGLLVTQSEVGDDDRLRVWNVMTGELVLGPLDFDFFYAHRLVFSPNGSVFAFERGSPSKTIDVWDVPGKKRRFAIWSIPDRAMPKLAMDPAGMRLAVSVDSLTGGVPSAVRVFDTTSGAEITKPLQHTGTISRVQFTHDGTRLLTVSDQTMVRFWDTTRWVPASEPMLSFCGFGDVHLSDDGRWLTALRVPQAGHRLELPVVVDPPPADLLRVLAMREASTRGSIEAIPLERWRALHAKVLARVAVLPAHDRWRALAEWSLAPPWARTLSPGMLMPTEEWLAHPLGQTTLLEQSPEEMKVMLMEQILAADAPPDVMEKMLSPQGDAEMQLQLGAMTGGISARLRRVDPGHPVFPLHDAVRTKDAAARAFLVKVAVERLGAASSELQRLGMFMLLRRLDPPEREAALVVAERATARDPKFRLNFMMKGRVLLELGRAAEAHAALRTAQGLAKDAAEGKDTEVLLPLAEAAWVTGDRAAALQTFREVVAEAPQWNDKEFIAASDELPAEERRLLEEIRRASEAQ